MPPLHVANGHCTTRLIEAAGLPGRTSIWADALHDGPVPDVSDEELIRIRAAFIADGLDVSAEEVEADLKQWRDVVDDDDGYDELVLWFEHDVFDQLNLIQLLTRVGRDRPIRKPVSLISIDRYPGHPHFKGLGELSPADIATLYDTRRPVTPQQFRWRPTRGMRFARASARASKPCSRTTRRRCRFSRPHCGAILPRPGASRRSDAQRAPAHRTTGRGAARHPRRLRRHARRRNGVLHHRFLLLADGEGPGRAIAGVDRRQRHRGAGGSTGLAIGHALVTSMNDKDRALLTEMRHLLLQLHKTLIDWQRADYETRARPAADHAAAQRDVQRSGIRVAAIDVGPDRPHRRSAGSQAARESELDRIRSAGGRGARADRAGSRQHVTRMRYHAALQELPEAVLAHRDLVQLLKLQRPASNA